MTGLVSILTKHDVWGLWSLRYYLKSENHQIPLQAFEKLAYNQDAIDNASSVGLEPEEDKIEEVECVLANLIAQVSELHINLSRNPDLLT